MSRRKGADWWLIDELRAAINDERAIDVRAADELLARLDRIATGEPIERVLDVYLDGRPVDERTRMYRAFLRSYVKALAKPGRMTSKRAIGYAATIVGDDDETVRRDVRAGDPALEDWVDDLDPEQREAQLRHFHAQHVAAVKRPPRRKRARTSRPRIR